MTVIAWDGKTLASDSLMSNGDDSEGPVKKLYHLKSGAILGESGMADARSIIALLDMVVSEQDLPSRSEIEALKVQGHYILVLPDSSAWSIDSVFDDDWKMFVGSVTPTRPPYSVAGTGGVFARTAMSLGLDAVSAVREACKHSLFCQEPIQVMTLDGPKEKIKRVRKPKHEPETPVE